MTAAEAHTLRKITVQRTLRLSLSRGQSNGIALKKTVSTNNYVSSNELRIYGSHVGVLIIFVSLNIIIKYNYKKKYIYIYYRFQIDR